MASVARLVVRILATVRAEPVEARPAPVGRPSTGSGRTGWAWHGLASALALLLPAGSTAQQQPPAPPVVKARVIARLPHDPQAFTEGFLVHRGRFYESTGQVGRSFIREVDPATGKVRRQVSVPPPYFGEGIAVVGGELVSLTWQDGTGFRWRLADFRRTGQFRYAGEGWALASDAKTLVMSDGTDVLRVLDPKTLAVVRRISVTWRGRPLKQLNEVELVDGEVLANVWHSNAIVRIDPATGRVTGVIDVSALAAEVKVADPEGVANGIAWDAARRKLYVTGKLWPTVFEIAWPGAR